jgi:Kef-type K+ transport system membrane component KefB
VLLNILLVVLVAFLAGKLVSKFRLPAILGWLITGMFMGPYALNILNEGIMSNEVYRIAMMILETSVGLMIGSELVISKLKKTGMQIIVTTLFQSLLTFGVVSLGFGVIFYFMDIPLFLAVVFGGIALATAPAPALSIVSEFKTDGPVTNALIPMAALDDILAIVVFFSITSIIGATFSGSTTSLAMTLVLMILLPIAIGIVGGLLAGVILKKDDHTLIKTIVMVLVVATIGIVFNEVILSEPVLNFMLIGMSFAATFANMVTEERLEDIMVQFNPVLLISLMIVIINLGAPLDYHLIFGADLFTLLYILTRAAGKYSGAYLGASITKMEPTVKKYLGLTLLPHSGVSLVFTGIAVSTISAFNPDAALILQGTIAAAAIINEIIAVILSKKAFEWAGEFGKAK